MRPTDLRLHTDTLAAPAQVQATVVRCLRIGGQTKLELLTGDQQTLTLQVATHEAAGAALAPGMSVGLDVQRAWSYPLNGSLSNGDLAP